MNKLRVSSLSFTNTKTNHDYDDDAFVPVLNTDVVLFWMWFYLCFSGESK